MPKFSIRSKLALSTCCKELQLICNEAIKEIDFIVLEGFRDKYAQNEAFANGKSKVKWPDGKHNKFPSLAVDVAPYPIDWNNHARFKKLAEVFKRIAKEKGIKLTWGGDWKGFPDLPHFQVDA